MTQQDASGQVLLAPVLSAYDALPTWGHKAQSRRLLDLGDHVEWVDGRRLWALPDQAAGRPELPVLARVVHADTTAFYPRINIRERHLMLVADDNTLLATVAVGSEKYTAMSFETSTACGTG